MTMCGITGIWTAGAAWRPQSIIDTMTDRLAHRGPDGRGVWADEDAGVALGHRRLAILDLSADGAQPMTSASGRYVLVYNGEIYNFRDLRRELLRHRDHPFRGTSDTEVLLAAIDRLGLDEALRRTNGMFALALWDRRERTLSVARDRLGIKPLYVGVVGRSLWFGSELSPLSDHPDFAGDLDHDAIADLLRYNSIPAPRSIYRGIEKLLPGTVATFFAPTSPARTRRFYDPARVVQRGLEDPLPDDDRQATDALERLLLGAVEDRMVADVPLGAFLSGGIDSSTVVALMQSISGRPVRTFSIGVADPGYDEASHAAAVAAHLGTDHTELYVHDDDAREVIPDLPRLYDEPFADSSQIPTYLVSRLARSQVTVALSGDGGDELFGGYNRHLWAPRIWRAVGPVPRLVRAALASALLAPDPHLVDASYRRLQPLLPAALQLRIPAEKLQKLAYILAVSGADQIYDRLRADWPDPAAVVPGATSHPHAPTAPPWLTDICARMMFRDLTGYLPDDILTKVDRASMAVGLEARVPLLDHRVAAFAWRLPPTMKIRGTTTKWILRQVLHRHVPRELIDRPKMGFGIPIGDWLRGPLRPWAEDLLDPGRLRREAIFNPEPITRIWREHLQGRANHQHRLWNVLMFQAWYQSRS